MSLTVAAKKIAEQVVLLITVSYKNLDSGNAKTNNKTFELVHCHSKLKEIRWFSFFFQLKIETYCIHQFFNLYLYDLGSNAIPSEIKNKEDK